MVIYNPRTQRRSGLQEALSAVSPEVGRALQEAHKRLIDANVPHVLVGGLAVGANGHAYNTKDVDFLVEKDAAFSGDLVVEFRPGIPIRIGSVLIDYLTPDGEPPVVRKLMEQALSEARVSPEEIRVIPTHVLVYMKLRAGRQKDLAAVVELTKAGVNVDEIRALLDELGDPQLSARFERCVHQAQVEDS